MTDSWRCFKCGSTWDGARLTCARCLELECAAGVVPAASYDTRAVMPRPVKEPDGGCNVRRFDPSDKPADLRSEDLLRQLKLSAHPWVHPAPRREIGRVVPAAKVDET